MANSGIALLDDLGFEWQAWFMRGVPAGPTRWPQQDLDHQWK